MKLKNIAWRMAGRLSWCWLFLFACGVMQAAWANGAGRASAVISGTVRDNFGNPIAGAVISVSREGAKKIARKVRSAANGNFRTRVAPGRYVLSALATGFGAVSFTSVNARSSQELVYRFNLTPVGAGRTLPEKRRDRDNIKWNFRGIFSRRVIFQQQEQDAADIVALETEPDSKQQDDGPPAQEPETETLETAESGAPQLNHKHGRTRGVVETYFASSEQTGPTTGVNFALATPATRNMTVVLAGQTGTGTAPQRLETTVQLRVAERHQINLSVGAMRLNSFLANDVPQRELGQISLRAVDEWTVSNGVVVVLGFDYARFVGAGSGAARVLKPRLGVQFDPNARTRVRAGLTPGDDINTSAPDGLTENNQPVFQNPSANNVAFVNGQPILDRSSRLEFGVERILTSTSSIEATAFFDTIDGRGVGLMSLPLSSLRGAGGATLTNVALQEGSARGVRVIYKRRMGLLTASAGVAFGRGQKLSPAGLDDAAQLFTDGNFRTAALQIGLNPWRNTRVHTVLRFSPHATVFAIDPLAGRLAVYDPSLSVLITQDLPTFGLPVRAEAIIDARNLLDAVVSTEDGEKSVSLLSTRRSLRGGISLRF